MVIIGHKENLRYLQTQVGNLSESIEYLREFRNDLSDYIHNVSCKIDHIQGYLDGTIENTNEESIDQ